LGTKAGSWRIVAVILAIPGLVSSAYLAYHAAFPQTLLYCPTSGPFDCNQVTSSPYSTLFGVSVAYLGLAWFVVVLGLLAMRKTGPIFTLWALAMAFVAYLVGAEVFLIHSVCVYCTVAHASAVLLGLPSIKLREEEG